MADYRRRSASSLFSSPKLFTGFSQKSFPDPDSLMSPTSILDSKSFSALRNPFWSDSSTPRTPRPEINKVPGPVGLGLIDALTHEESDSKSEPCPVVLFGSQLKIQIPLLPPLHPPSANSPLDSPMSPADFGIKTTKNSQTQMPFSPVFSPSSAKKSPFGSSNSGLESSNSPRNFSSLSISEMELSEEYTRVICHGPNPKTTHIFDDCVVVESCCYGGSNLGTCSSARSYGNNNNNNVLPISRSMSYPSENFLSFCYKCKKKLGQGKDIYMYRGEKAFCSIECRDEEMMLEESRGMTEESAGF